MSTYEKIMHAIVAVFTAWFCMLSIGQLSLFTGVSPVAETASGTSDSLSGAQVAALDNVKPSDDLLARLSAAMKKVKQVPLSKGGVFRPSTGKTIPVTTNTVVNKPIATRASRGKPVIAKPVIAKPVTARGIEKPIARKYASQKHVAARTAITKPVVAKSKVTNSGSSSSSGSVIDGLMNKALKFNTYRTSAGPSKEQLKKAKVLRPAKLPSVVASAGIQLPVAKTRPVALANEAAAVKEQTQVVKSETASASVKAAASLEDIFVSRKGEATRVDLQFSADTDYSVDYDEANSLLKVNLRNISESNLKATFPPLVVLSSVKYSRDNSGKGTSVALTLASNVEPDKGCENSSGKSSRLRLSFVSREMTSVSADGSTYIAADQKWLGEGLQYMKYRYQPEKLTGTDVHILRYSLNSKEYGIGLQLAQDKILGKARLSEMVKQSKHVAAVNASFFSGTGEPLGLLSTNRQVLSVPVSKRACFGVFNGERALLGNPGFTGKVYTAKGEFALEGINQTGNGAKDRMMVYTPEFGSSTKTKGSGLELAIADGRIVAVQENDTPVPPNGFVVGMRGTPAPEMSETKFWDKVKFKWGLTPPWDVADFAIGGGPMLLEDGEDKITWKEEKFSRAFAVTAAPRTAVGIADNGDIFLVVADGRDKNRNRGLSLNELASVMRRSGCKSAINLDGGGSTTMWINGKVVNRPSDGRERKISSAIVLTRQNPSMYAASRMGDGIIRGI